MPTNLLTTLARRVVVMFAVLAVLSSSVLATTYYVSPYGNDNYTRAQAANIATPWKTIQHAMYGMAAGDTCLIRSGTYQETVWASISGSASAPITFQAYNNEVVTISGTAAVTGWVRESGNIYSAPVTLSLGDGNQVFKNGVMLPESRWPNAGNAFPWQNSSLKPSPDWSYLTGAGYVNSTSSWFSDSALPSRPDNYWVGATVHVMSGYGWVMQFPKVTSSSGTVLYTNGPDSSDPALALTTGNEYYLSGIKGELDSEGEWYYDSANNRLYIYSSTTPTNIEAKQRIYGFGLWEKSYIHLVNLHFFACTIQTSTNSTYEVFDGLSMRYLSHCNVDTYWSGLSLYKGTILKNSELAFDSRGLVSIMGDDVQVVNNHLHDSGYMPSWPAMVQSGCVNRALISHNTMHDSGRAIMGYPGMSGIVEYNDMSNGMRLTTDGGILYSYMDAGNSVIRYNKLRDSAGPVGHQGASVQGLYLDSEDCNWVVHHNIISNVPGSSIQINARNNFCMIFNNTCANVGASGLTTYASTDGETGTKIYNNIIGKALTGDMGTWADTDLRNNLFIDPGFLTGTFQSTNSQVVDQGLTIPGVTDASSGLAPDLGALESGGSDWTSSVGYTATPPTPFPSYSFPVMTFSNLVKDGGFERGSLTPNWTVNGSTVSLLNGNAWTDARLRTGAYTLQVGQGSSTVSQVVTGLQPGRRYRLYVGVQAATASTAIKLGVRNGGYNAVEVPVLSTGVWEMNGLTFFTGATNTTAEIYMSVVSTSATPVYMDDISVERDQPVPSVATVPILNYTFNQSAGVTVTDSGAYAQHGTICGTLSPAWQSGKIGNALGFDGSSVYVVTPSADTPAELTVCCWAKSNTATWNDYGCLISKRPSFIIHPQKDSKDIVFSVNTAATTSATLLWSPDSSFDITAWHHYAGVYSPSKQLLTFYVDGVLVEWGNASGAYSTNGPTYIGKDSTLGRFFNGKIDDVRIYNKALSSGDMKAVAAVDSSLALRLALDESSGASKAWDSSGYGVNGALTNMNLTTAWGSGIVNGALSFNGTNSYVSSPCSVPSTASGSFTVSEWVKFTDIGTATTYPTLFSNNNDQWGRKGWQIKVAKVSPATNFTIGFYLWSTDQTSPPTEGTYATAWFGGSIAPAQWTHVAFVVDRGSGIITGYLNGVAAASTTIPAGFADVMTTQGTMVGSSLFNGQLDDARIYSRALSWYEILDLATKNNKSPYY